MKNESIAHEFSLPIYDAKATRIGDVDVRVGYCVDDDVSINVYEVEMLNAPKSGRKAVYIDAWDWLYEAACDWCDENAYDLVAAARLEITSRREDYADSQRDERRDGA